MVVAGSIILIVVMFCDIVVGSQIENQKRRILDKINLTDRPNVIANPPTSIPDDYDDYYEHAGKYGGRIIKEILEPSDAWECMTETTVEDNCFEYVLNISRTLKSAYMVIHTKKLTNISNLIVVANSIDEETGAMIEELDRFEYSEVVVSSSFKILLDMTSPFSDWLTEKQKSKFIKLDMYFNGVLVDLIEDYIDFAPFFELKTFQPYDFPDESCPLCGFKSFYLNFTEIGWNDWILFPKGYYANYCEGNCTGEKREDPWMPVKECIPTLYGSVNFVVAEGENDYRSHLVHALRVLSCGCA